jgi:hypothetical protein
MLVIETIKLRDDCVEPNIGGRIRNLMGLPIRILGEISILFVEENGYRSIIFFSMNLKE